ncbi:MAG: hypothetical protein V8R51_02210 [Clostridia bacterium]
MLLVFMLHYIMVFAVYINESIVKLIGATTDKNQSIEIISLKNMDRKKNLLRLYIRLLEEKQMNTL